MKDKTDIHIEMMQELIRRGFDRQDIAIKDDEYLEKLLTSTNDSEEKIKRHEAIRDTASN